MPKCAQGNVKEGSKVDLVQQESPPDLDTQNMNKEVHTYFGSIELDSVSDSRKSTKSLITLNPLTPVPPVTARAKNCSISLCRP